MYLHDELKHENAKLKQLLTEKNEEVRRLENSRNTHSVEAIILGEKIIMGLFNSI